jgi:hypothetical protein
MELIMRIDRYKPQRVCDKCFGSGEHPPKDVQAVDPKGE